MKEISAKNIELQERGQKTLPGGVVPNRFSIVGEASCGNGLCIGVDRTGGCVARQYAWKTNSLGSTVESRIRRALTSKYSAKWLQASSNWFSSRMTSNISGGHWLSFSAATIWTDKFFAWAFPRDLINLCKTLKRVWRLGWSDKNLGTFSWVWKLSKCSSLASLRSASL